MSFKEHITLQVTVVAVFIAGLLAVCFRSCQVSNPEKVLEVRPELKAEEINPYVLETYHMFRIRANVIEQKWREAGKSLAPMQEMWVAHLNLPLESWPEEERNAYKELRATVEICAREYDAMASAYEKDLKKTGFAKDLTKTYFFQNGLSGPLPKYDEKFAERLKESF